MYRLRFTSKVEEEVVQVDLVIKAVTKQDTGIELSSGMEFQSRGEADLVQKSVARVLNNLAMEVYKQEVKKEYRVKCVNNGKYVDFKSPYWYPDIQSGAVGKCTSLQGTVFKTGDTAKAMCNKINKLTQTFIFIVEEVRDVHHNG